MMVETPKLRLLPNVDEHLNLLCFDARLKLQIGNVSHKVRSSFFFLLLACHNANRKENNIFRRSAIGYKIIHNIVLKMIEYSIWNWKKKIEWYLMHTRVGGCVCVWYIILCIKCSRIILNFINRLLKTNIRLKVYLKKIYVEKRNMTRLY